MALHVTVHPGKCTGCRLCELACSEAKAGVYRPSVSRIRVVNFLKEGVSVPLLCRQCDECGPLDVCPEDAISRAADGAAILVDDSLCTGCGRCSSECPYGALSFDPDTGRLLLCDLCGGEPACVGLCFTDAICGSDSVVPATRADAGDYVQLLKSEVLRDRASVEKG